MSNEVMLYQDTNTYFNKLGALPSPPVFSPWEYDQLDRREIASTLTKLARSYNEPFVLSISAPWGMGKTEFLRMWQAQLLTENQPALYYNAWNSDYTDNSLLSFITSLQTEINSQLPLMNTIYEGIRSKASEFLPILGGMALRIATRNMLKNEDIQNILELGNDEADTISYKLSQQGQQLLKKFTQTTKDRKLFHQNLINFAAAMKANGAKLPIIILIDELDRCRPTYTVELLESIKHLFNVPGFFFVLGLDRTQLHNSIKTLYGSEMDTGGYLRRFIDLDFDLPEPSPSMLFTMLSNRLGINHLLKQNEKLLAQLATMQELIGPLLNMSIRDHGICLMQLNIAIRTELCFSRLFPFYYVLAMIRMKRHDIFQSLLNGSIESDLIKTFFLNNLQQPENKYYFCFGYLKATFSAFTLSKYQFNENHKRVGDETLGMQETNPDIERNRHYLASITQISSELGKISDYEEIRAIPKKINSFMFFRMT